MPTLTFCSADKNSCTKENISKKNFIVSEELTPRNAELEDLLKFCKPLCESPVAKNP